MSLKPKFEFGDEVRVTRTVRDDGTFPGKAIGDILVRRGSKGFVRDVGTFLQDQLIYSVDFFEQGIMVGCREQELQGADEPWINARFEFRDKVVSKIPLGIEGEVVAEPGDVGEILKVITQAPDKVFYHVRYPGRTFQVPEKALDAAPREEAESNSEQKEVEVS